MTERRSSKTGSPGEQGDLLRKPPFDEDIAFQRRQWGAERFGWAAMVIVIIGALAGVFGGAGIAARATTSDSSGLIELQYARFARNASSMTLDVTVAAAATSGRPLRLRVSDRYLSATKVRAITPPPNSTSVGDGQHVFVFDRASSGSATIRFELAPESMGRHDGWIAVDDGAPVLFSHFVYP